MPPHPEALYQHRAQPMPCASPLDERMTAIASGIGQTFVCDLLVDVQAAGGIPNDLLGLLARMTAGSVQFCFRPEDHETALSKVSTQAARLLRAGR